MQRSKFLYFKDLELNGILRFAEGNTVANGEFLEMPYNLSEKMPVRCWNIGEGTGENAL